MLRLLCQIACVCLIFLITGSKVFAQFDEFGKTNPQHEIEIGRQASKEVELLYPLSKNRTNQERVRRIGNSLIEQLPQKAYTYEFKVLATPDFNAFCLPGGFMYVYEGLLAKLPDDNAVAFVMAHEITHAAHRHWAHHMEKMKGVSMGAILFGALTGSSDAASIARSLVSLKYSRADEYDADKTGMELAWMAGYDTNGAIEAARVMEELEKGSHIPEYLRDHPSASDRLSHLEAEAAELSKRKRPSVIGASSVEIDLTDIAGTLPEGIISSNPWFPLADGNEWTYQIDDGAGGKSAYAFRVVSKIKLKKGDIYRAETILGKNMMVPCQIMTTANAVWRRNRPTDIRSKWQVEYAVPLNQEQAITMNDAALFTWMKPESVTASCGLFTDIAKVREKYGDKTFDIWFARGVGRIKSVCKETGVTETLIAYKVKNFDSVH